MIKLVRTLEFKGQRTRESSIVGYIVRVNETSCIRFGGPLPIANLNLPYLEAPFKKAGKAPLKLDRSAYTA